MRLFHFATILWWPLRKLRFPWRALGSSTISNSWAVIENTNILDRVERIFNGKIIEGFNIFFLHSFSTISKIMTSIHILTMGLDRSSGKFQQPRSNLCKSYLETSVLAINFGRLNRLKSHKFLSSFGCSIFIFFLNFIVLNGTIGTSIQLSTTLNFAENRGPQALQTQFDPSARWTSKRATKQLPPHKLRSKSGSRPMNYLVPSRQTSTIPRQRAVPRP